MNVLSLFDGMSCGRIALDRLGIEPSTYFASEIDKNAIKVSKANWSDVIHIGDVTKVSYKGGVLYTEYGSYCVDIDLLLGGSPCQDFSVAKTMDVKSGGLSQGLAGDKSSLFYHYLRILGEIKQHNPDVKWLLENVKMKKLSKEQLDTYLETTGVLINSNLVSFQNRPRVYWSNLKVTLPEDKQINFQDYKETGELDEYKLKKTKSREHMWNDGNGRNAANYGCTNVTNAGKIQCLTTKQDRCPNSGLVEYEDFCRYLTRTELELAQTVPVGYTNCLSYNQACAVLGNGWTVDVIVHILKGLE